MITALIRPLAFNVAGKILNNGFRAGIG